MSPIARRTALRRIAWQRHSPAIWGLCRQMHQGAEGQQGGAQRCRTACVSCWGGEARGASYSNETIDSIHEIVVLYIRSYGHESRNPRLQTLLLDVHISYVQFKLKIRVSSCASQSAFSLAPYLTQIFNLTEHTQSAAANERIPLGLSQRTDWDCDACEDRGQPPLATHPSQCSQQSCRSS